MKEGDKVICINSVYIHDRLRPNAFRNIIFPTKGKVYIVRDLVINKYGIGIRLEEIQNRLIYNEKGGYQEPIFDIRRFKLIENDSI